MEGETDALSLCSPALPRVTLGRDSPFSSRFSVNRTPDLQGGGLEFAKNRVRMLRPKQHSLFWFLLSWAHISVERIGAGQSAGGADSHSAQAQFYGAA